MNLPIEVPLEFVFVALWAGLAGWAIVDVLLRREDPYAAWAWIVLCALLPFGGVAWYWLFGINRVRTRARKRGPQPRSRRKVDPPQTGEARNDAAASAVPAALSEVARTGDVLTQRPLLEGNALAILHDGEQAYPRMLAAIAAAQRWIALEIYIFDYDRAGIAFIEALIAAQARGVEVRCLLDGVGEFAWRRAGSELRDRGIKVTRFNPIRFWPPFLHINLRNHRKLMLVDGCIGFAGGMNISATQYASDATHPRRQTDVQIEVRGPVLDQLTEMFCDDWRYASDEDWRPDGTTTPAPPLDAAVTDDAACRLITDGPNEDLGQLSAVTLAAINAAQRRVYVVMPYFLPPGDMLSALCAAAVRGVEVDVILPRVTDQPITHYAARKNFAPLLARGVRIHYQPPPFCHAKLFVVDDTYAQFGSANFDPRSFRLNFELMVEAYDRRFATALAAHFRELIAKSERITARRVRLRTLPAQLRDAVCWLFTPYL